jgi:hypothetical protein
LTIHVVLVSHSIVGYPFPDDGYGSTALALGASVHSYSQPLDHYPRSSGAEAFLRWRFIDGYGDAVYITNQFSFLIVSRFIYLMASSTRQLLDNHADPSPSDPQPDEELRFYANLNIPSPKFQPPKKEPASKARCPVLNPDASPHTNLLV